jgi:hypothetical protein
MPSEYWKRNNVLAEALGISGIEFQYYRAGQAHWRVSLKDGGEFTLATHNLSTARTVLKLAAEKLAKMGRVVEYPTKGVE